MQLSRETLFEEGDGDDSDNEGGERELHTAAMNLGEISERNDVELALDADEWGAIPGSPDSWTPPCAPPDFKPYEPKYDVPSLDNLDNPGGWSEYTYQPKYTGSRENRSYVGHFTPGGATVVPKNENGERVIGEWEFSYCGYEASDADKGNCVRLEATTENIKPDCRKGKLDVNLLKALGCNIEKVKDCDAFFFFQCLFPVCLIEKSGVDNDKWLPFMSTIQMHTNVYAHGIKGWGGLYFHSFNSVSKEELVKWFGIIIHDGAWGSTNGAIHWYWMLSDPDHDELIMNAMTYSQFLQIKSVIKLNNNYESKQQDHPDYDPTSKYDYIFKVLVYNMANVTEKADDDLCIDETTWAYAGYGGPAVARIKGKPGINKGGQTEMTYDVNWHYPRGYIHRHSLVKKDPRFTTQGPNEVFLLCEQVKSILNIEGSDDHYNTDGSWKIFDRLPHITADNHFSGDAIAKYMGEEGFGYTCTTRRDRLPSAIDKKYLNALKQMDTSSNHLKVACYENPIVAVKRVESLESTKAYTHCLVSFQSTGTTNITCINALPSCKLYVTTKEQGQGKNKHKWGIENNEGRELYLSTYWAVDAVDKLIKFANIFYLSWKYWHSPMRHAIAAGIVAAFGMYEECCDDGFDQEWAVLPEERMDYCGFHLNLSSQMLQYNPSNRKYKHDASMRKATQTKQKSRNLSPIYLMNQMIWETKSLWMSCVRQRR